MALNIIRTGVQLLRTSVAGLLDVTLPEEENQQIVKILQGHVKKDKISFHGLQTRQAGRHRFINVDLQVPGKWSVTQGHDLAMVIEAEINAALSDSTIVIHVEPIEDASSYEDIPEGYIPLDFDDDQIG